MCRSRSRVEDVDASTNAEPCSKAESARPASFKNLGTPDQMMIEQHILTHFPNQPWCKRSVEDATHCIENSRKSVFNFSLTSKTWETEVFKDLVPSAPTHVTVMSNT